MSQSLEEGRSQLVMYMDDVRPGNVLRPDHGRVFYAFYWSMLGMPSWWTTSEWGWYDLCFILHTRMTTILGGTFFLSSPVSIMWGSVVGGGPLKSPGCL